MAKISSKISLIICSKVEISNYYNLFVLEKGYIILFDI